MNQAEYPQKTCSIERLITRQEDVQRVLAGKKKAQRRNGLYAYPGEQMILENQPFIITAVYRQTLGAMNDRDAVQEGQIDKKAYMSYLNHIHPGVPWSFDMVMWVHEFERAT
ncbi:ASCH domain-containing protein [Desmospora profundinema]|uniref:ASCH domain-containing protein n=1 Tax=Desmospora profundinema TaxID=1571184 RepID=A0ABU1IPK3_9BACL|nr:ASCH domain-containing protein [Desmospora profundinema]MDR6226726.1 hypothetical protein [Desmospora profundinema]